MKHKTAKEILSKYLFNNLSGVDYLTSGNAEKAMEEYHNQFTPVISQEEIKELREKFMKEFGTDDDTSDPLIVSTIFNFFTPYLSPSKQTSCIEDENINCETK